MCYIGLIAHIFYTALTLEVAMLLIIYPMILGKLHVYISSIAVEPFTNGQYRGLEQNWAFSPPFGFQCTPLHLGRGYKSQVIQYNLVNEEDMWKCIVNQLNFKGKLLNSPLIGLCIHMI